MERTFAVEDGNEHKVVPRRSGGESAPSVDFYTHILASF